MRLTHWLLISWELDMTMLWSLFDIISDCWILDSQNALGCSCESKLLDGCTISWSTCNQLHCIHAPSPWWQHSAAAMRRGQSLWLTLTTAVPASSQGDPTCWLGEINYQTCCLPPPTGNPNCWDGTYSYQRCCREVGEAVDINAVEDISQLGGCELNIFQEFKARSGVPLGPSPALLLCWFLFLQKRGSGVYPPGAWYRNGTPNLVLFQEFGYIARRFDSMYRSKMRTSHVSFWRLWHLWHSLTLTCKKRIPISNRYIIKQQGVIPHPHVVGCPLRSCAPAVGS